jgi:glutamate dehydrogenase
VTAGPDTSYLASAYARTYRGPDGTAGHDPVVPPALIAAQERLASLRQPGETLVEVYGRGDGGFGPALQIVTDQASILMDSITVLLHRLGVAYTAVMYPTMQVRRLPDGSLADVRPAEAGATATEESWIHIELADTVNQRALTEAVRLLPMVVADARQVAQDSAALSASLLQLAHDIAADDGTRFPGADRMDVSYLLRWLDIHFVLLGAQRCTIVDGVATADESTRLGVARLRTEVLPELSEPGETLVLAQATMPSFLRYGSYPYIVVVRETGSATSYPAWSICPATATPPAFDWPCRTS